jgi:hypothetical protein
MLHEAEHRCCKFRKCLDNIRASPVLPLLNTLTKCTCQPRTVCGLQTTALRVKKNLHLGFLLCGDKPRAA